MRHLLCYFWLLAGLLLASGPAQAQAPAASLAAEAGWGAQHPLASGVLAGTIGFALGAWLMRRWTRKHYHRAIHQARQKARAEAEHAASLKKGNTARSPNNYDKLKEENTALKQQVAAFTRQRATPAATKPKHRWPTEAELAPEGSVPAAPLPPTPPPPPPAAVLTSSVEAGPPPTLAAEAPPAAPEVAPEAVAASADSAAPAPAPSTTRYAPAQETGFLRDNKLATEPLPQLPLLLTLCPDDPEKAFFTLNPHVNQAKLIGDGLHQLREFFEFDLPTGRIAAVSADAPGQLARQGDGWQVVRRARLLVH